MRIEGLLLEGFRNYDSQQLNFDESCNVIYGDNAQGKTNLLEAIVYLSCGRSPRTHADRELIASERTGPGWWDRSGPGNGNLKRRFS